MCQIQVDKHDQNERKTLTWRLLSFFIIRDYNSFRDLHSLSIQLPTWDEWFFSNSLPLSVQAAGPDGIPIYGMAQLDPIVKRLNCMITFYLLWQLLCLPKSDSGRIREKKKNKENDFLLTGLLRTCSGHFYLLVNGVNGIMVNFMHNFHRK